MRSRSSLYRSLRQSSQFQSAHSRQRGASTTVAHPSITGMRLYCPCSPSAIEANQAATSSAESSNGQNTPRSRYIQCLCQVTLSSSRQGEKGKSLLSTEYRVPSTEYRVSLPHSVLGTRY